MPEIKEKQDTRATIDRITFDLATRKACFTLLNCEDTFVVEVPSGSRGLEAALMLTRPGDEVCVRVDCLPQHGLLCQVDYFKNQFLRVKH